MNRRISILIITSLYLFAGTTLANRYNNEDGDERDYFNAGVEIESLWNLTGDDFAVYKAAEAYYEEVASLQLQLSRPVPLQSILPNCPVQVWGNVHGSIRTHDRHPGNL